MSAFDKTKKELQALYREAFEDGRDAAIAVMIGSLRKQRDKYAAERREAASGHDITSYLASEDLLRELASSLEEGKLVPRPIDRMERERKQCEVVAEAYQQGIADGTDMAVARIVRALRNIEEAHRKIHRRAVTENDTSTTMTASISMNLASHVAQRIESGKWLADEELGASP